MKLQGIDVSRHNGAVDWEKAARAGIRFAILRAAYGKSGVDDRFDENYQGARRAGLLVGAYHYSYALTPADARREAQHLLAVLNGRALDQPVWFDMEDADGYKKKHGFTFTKRNISAITQAFVDTIRASGRKCGVYASKSWFENYIKVDADAVWVAQWASKPTYAGHYDVWQNSDAGTVPGVTGRVDTNVLYTEFWKEDNEVKYYEKLAEIPAGELRDTVKLLVDRKIIAGTDSGLHLSEDMVRLMVFNRRAGLYQ